MPKYRNPRARLGIYANGSLAGRMAARSARRRTGLQRQGMELAAHLALERLIDNLMLLDAGLAAKRLGGDGRSVMVAVAGQIADRHLRIRYARADQTLDIARSHRHVVITGVGPIARPSIPLCAMWQPQCGGWRLASMCRRLQTRNAS